MAEYEIKSGGIRKLNVIATAEKDLGHLTVFIHHEMTPERIAELVVYIEAAVTDIVKAFAA
jgi:hypothetical protein